MATFKLIRGFVLLALAMPVTFIFTPVHAHDINEQRIPAKEWRLSEQLSVSADFIKLDKDKVYLADNHHQLLSFELSEFSRADQDYILHKNEKIKAINQLALSRVPASQNMTTAHSADLISNINKTSVPANDIAFLTSIFSKFENVTTRHDNKYFYIESNGIPTHEMMTGITSWQQQVPIDHDYSGDNSWAIPLRPELADKPLSTQKNFMKGAIAIGVNGIPIFNPLNNRGEDALAFGELDNWGGHSGRADDYHYHIAPTHLQSQVGEGKPIAYALDGFPVYGPVDGVPRGELDEYLGKFAEDGSYEYHAVSEFPYLIAGLRGKVDINPRTKAPENEIAPQAHTRGVRPDLQPLGGAEITGFKIISPRQYSLSYTQNGNPYQLNYSWGEGESSKNYTFEFVGPNGTRTETYRRK